MIEHSEAQELFYAQAFLKLMRDGQRVGVVGEDRSALSLGLISVLAWLLVSAFLIFDGRPYLSFLLKS
jgi:hypothetical protein